MSMLMRESEEYFEKGVKAFANGHHHLALTCFERTPEMTSSPQGSIYLALCLVKARGEYDRAIALVNAAIGREPQNQEHFITLGEILIMANRRQEAIDAFCRGMQLGRCEEIERQLESLGRRKPPVFESLGRSHPVNKYLGKVLTKLGFR